jgi:hypothetical protein
MGSVAKRPCARGRQCTQYRFLGEPAKVRSSSESALCERCSQEHAEGIRSPNTPSWITDAIEAMFPGEGAQRSLWDLFELNPHNGGWGKYSDRGEVLGRLDAKTLDKLRDWLAEHAEEAINRYGRNRYAGLYSTVSVLTRLESLPPDKSLRPGEQGTVLPFDAVAVYKSSGRAVDLKTPILAAALAETLRKKRSYISERDVERTVEEELGVPRSTLKRWFQRMEEVGMTWRSFTTEQLEYVTLGNKRGMKPGSQ